MLIHVQYHMYRIYPSIQVKVIHVQYHMYGKYPNIYTPMIIIQYHIYCTYPSIYPNDNNACTVSHMAIQRKDL